MKLSNAKSVVLTSVITFCMMLAGTVYLYSQSFLYNTPSDYSRSELKAIVIDDFESGTVGEEGWKVMTTPRQFLKGEESKQKKIKNPVPVLEMKFMEGGPANLTADKYAEITGLGKTKDRCLGLRFMFRYPGYNRIDILPPPEVMWQDHKTPVETYNPSTGNYEQERGIQLPGRAKGLSMWVQARHHRYTLEVWVKDWTGETHRIMMDAEPLAGEKGSINFLGWRPMKAELPKHMPQAVTSYPQTRYAKITRFVIRSHPEAKAGEEVRIWFDQLKVLTDVFESSFDGSELDRGFGGSGSSKETKDTNKETKQGNK